MSEMQHFPNFSYVGANFRIELSLDKYSSRFTEAQQWLGDRVLEDSKPFMPILTGSLQQRSHTENDGKRVIYPGPYGRFQYGGKVMVDPVTGSPWARKGAKKVLTDRPLKYSNPQATAKWFDAAKEVNLEYWLNGVRKIIGGK